MDIGQGGLAPVLWLLHCSCCFMMFLLAETPTPPPGCILLIVSHRKPPLTLQAGSGPPLGTFFFISSPWSTFPHFLFACTAAEGPRRAGLQLFSSTPGLQGSLHRHLWNEWMGEKGIQLYSPPFPCSGALCTLVKHLGFPSGSVRVPPKWAGSSSGLMNFSRPSFQLSGGRGVEGQ